MTINRSPREARRLDRAGELEKARIVYVADDCAAAEAAAEAVRRTAPAALDGIPLDAVEVTASPGGGIYEVTATYAAATGNRKLRDRRPGDRMWKFSVNCRSGETSDSLGTVRSIYPDPGTPRIAPGTRIDWNGLTGQDAVTGRVSVLKPVFTETCRATFRASRLNTAYLRRAAAAAGKVNSAPFRHWQPGEVLLESIVQGDLFRNSAGIELCDVVFGFAIRPNGPRQCAGITVDAVDGWDYLWPVTAIAPDGGGETVTALHVSRIYERTQFNILEL